MFKNRWWIAFAAAWINFFIFAIFRSAGVFYISLKQTYNCTHQQAAWPVSVSGSIASICGILVGFISHYLTLRSLIIFGILVSSSSISFTYYADSIEFVTLTIGFLQGIGIGFVTCTLPAVLNQHFPDKKAVALGISYAGATLGGFIFPVMIHHLLKLFNLHKTFLFIGILTTLSLLGSIFMKVKKNNQKNQNRLIQMKEFATVSQALPNHFSLTPSPSPSPPPPPPSLSPSPIIKSISSNIEKNQRPLIEECNTIVYVDDNKVYANITENGTHHDSDTSTTLSDNENSENDINYQITNNNNDQKNKITYISSKVLLNIKNDWKLMANFTFVLCTFSYINFILDFVSFLIILPDIANDRGIDESYSKWLLSIFSLTDFIGRILPGWLSDINLITDKNIYILSLTFLGLSMALIIIVHEWIHFVILTLICGFASGCQMVLSPAILADYFGIENTAITFGFANFLCGIVTLATRPLIIGSKNLYGNYKLLSHVLSFATIGTGLIWLIESVMNFNLNP